MAASIKDVAKRAGVSVSTVSRALNGYTDISEKTKQNIIQISKELDYTPNLNAKSLASKTHKNVAMIVSGFSQAKQTDEFTMALMQGADIYNIKHNMIMATYTIDSDYQTKKSFEEFCKQYSLSGALLMGLRTTDRYVTTLCESTIPCVTIDIEIKGDCIGGIVTDDETAFEEITQYVIDRNHRKLILVYGRKQSRVAILRYKGFCSALKKNNLNIDTVPIIYTDFMEETAYSHTKNIVHRYGKDIGTAFICMSDITAFGVIRAIKECGYKIPDDFSVTGYDGMSFRNYIEPNITTIQQNMRQKGYMAAKLLYQMVNGKSKNKTVIVQHSLLEGNSVRYI